MHAHRLACRSCLVLVFLTEIPYPVPTQYLNLIPVIPRLSFYWYSYSYGTTTYSTSIVLVQYRFVYNLQ